MHQAVLLKEIQEYLKPKAGDVVLDGTLGAAGHAKMLGEAVGSTGTLIGLDQDQNAVLLAREVLEKLPCAKHLSLSNFRNMDQVVQTLGIQKLDRILLDLGLSSVQLEESGRGFSFKNDEPLIMTFKTIPGEDDFTAEQIVNDWSEESIANVLFGYGEERYARRIAKAIVDARERKRITRTGELRELIESAVPKKYLHSKIHPATRTFQALRIAVNDELKALEDAIQKGVSLLRSEGRFAIISFHSIEDRIVKQHFANFEKEGKGKRISKKPITPSEEEIRENPRARSAKLRIFENN